MRTIAMVSGWILGIFGAIVTSRALAEGDLLGIAFGIALAICGQRLAAPPEPHAAAELPREYHPSPHRR